MAQIRIRQGRMFQKGVSYAKRARGTYQAGTQTWTIPDACAMLNAPSAYGWELVKAETVTQVCPRCKTYCDGDCR